jgi:MTH538 TIR-like domain (DUF1863)
MAGLMGSNFGTSLKSLGQQSAASSLLFGNLETKRKVFFSFHYDDIMRVNNVRNAWKINHPDSLLVRSFYDSSLWESRKLEGDEAVKRLIREGVQNTSAVCVLIGSETSQRRWVKYEIARSVIDRRGLLGVHINSLNHHERLKSDWLGTNPLENIGVFKNTRGEFYLYERQITLGLMLGYTNNNQWVQYQDHRQQVPLPKYLPEPTVGYVMPLSKRTPVYDYVQHMGHLNIGGWIDLAARSAGR